MPRGEGIKKLSELFEKYKRTLKAPQGSVIKEFCEVVDELYSISIPKEKVTYNTYTRVLSLTVSGPLKTEVVLHKKEIITHLKGRLGEKSAPKEII